MKSPYSKPFLVCLCNVSPYLSRLDTQLPRTCGQMHAGCLGYNKRTQLEILSNLYVPYRYPGMYRDFSVAQEKNLLPCNRLWINDKPKSQGCAISRAGVIRQNVTLAIIVFCMRAGRQDCGRKRVVDLSNIHIDECFHVSDMHVSRHLYVTHCKKLLKFKFKLLYFPNKASYRAENTQADIFL